jgi:hypothetical protein
MQSILGGYKLSGLVNKKNAISSDKVSGKDACFAIRCDYLLSVLFCDKSHINSVG